MRTTLIRIAKHGGLVAAGLWIFGIMFGQLAGLWMDSQAPVRNGPILTGELVDPNAKSGGEVFAESVRWRVPFAMAGWGFLLVATFELLAGIWRRPEVSPAKIDPRQANAEEEMIQQLLREAEFKVTNLSNTPAPVGELKNASESPA